MRVGVGFICAALAASAWWGVAGCSQPEEVEGETSTPEAIATPGEAAPSAREIEVVELGRPGAPPQPTDADASWAGPASGVEAQAPAPGIRGSATGDPPSQLAEILYAAVDTQDPERILDAIAALAELGGQTAIDTLSKVLAASGNPDTKIEALDALAFLADEGNVDDAIRIALTDPSPLVRMEAADIAAELLLVELLPDLRAAMAHESDPETTDVMSDAVFEIEIEEEISP